MSLVPRLPAHAEATLHAFLRAHVQDAGAEGVVVGLSGGIDSALTARLAKDALGAARVLGVLQPESAYPEALAVETQAYARGLGIEFRTVALTPAEEAFRTMLPELRDRTTVGNTKARIRMIVLYAIARESHRLVLGTGNKSEILLGYFTKYGDGGADLLPLGDLYKTELRELAARLDLPEAIRTRAPTAGLWDGQTDEGELGLPYTEIDQVLRGMEELRDPAEIARRSGVPLGLVRALEARVAANRHKRRLPPIPKLSLRTVGLDWRD
jgi:NAD+ synthase